MIVYNDTKQNFLTDVENDRIAFKVEELLFQKLKRHTGKSEFRSWENSMQHMYKVLSDSQIPSDAGIAIEYNVPQTSKRVDFLISGYNTQNKPDVVIIELKQWEEIKPVESSDSLVTTYTGGSNRTVVHPSYQAWSYASLIRDYNQNVQDSNILLNPCAYLHNYKKINDNDPLTSSQYNTYIEEAPVFVNGDVTKLRNFIKNCITTGDNSSIIYDIDNGKIRPSKSLQNAISNMIKGNREFVMIDDQQVVFEKIFEISKKAFETKKKYTIIVEGGPGTGKSVIAINLLAKLTQTGQFAQYVSKNSAPRTVYSKKLKGTMKKNSIDNMFKGSGIYTEADENIVHTILVDEAHRLNAKSGMFQNMGENQIKEIIHAAYCSVFFIDESQRVTMSDIGSVKEIEKWADTLNSQIIKMTLTSQFRCNGSDGYIAWIDNALQIRETANISMKEMDYDIKIVDSAMELKNLIFEKNSQNGRSRLLAGYCWDWNKSEQNNTDYCDIEIGDFRMSWNLGNTIFAIDDTSINQVGCIHTTQGLEFDYVGVIIGEDMRYSNGKIITDFNKRARTDQSLKGIKKLYKENPSKALERADEIIKNTYRTLLTRGMKGCYIYCVDKNLANHLKDMIK